MQLQRLTAEHAETWSRVGDQEINVCDIVDQASAPDARMTVGFARVGKAYTVRTEDGEAVTARAGEVIYLPAGSSNAAYVEDDAEMVYVANPPSVYAEHVAAS